MTLEELLNSIPSYAKDLKLNLSGMLRQPELTPNQTWGTAVACAMAVRNPTVLAVMLGEAAKQVPAEMIEASRSAAAIMGMNNVYYRFLHLVGNEKYSTIPARLRMNVLRTHGVNPAEFELWCMAVSAVNNCEACVRSHERVLREKGVPEDTILAAVRLGALIHAVAMVM